MSQKCGVCGEWFDYTEVSARIMKIGDPVRICNPCLAIEQRPRLAHELNLATKKIQSLERAIIEIWEAGVAGQVSAKSRDAYLEAKSHWE